MYIYINGTYSVWQLKSLVSIGCMALYIDSYNEFSVRRGGRVVECTWLEIKRTVKGTEGSNPSLSAKTSQYFSLRVYLL